MLILGLRLAFKSFGNQRKCIETNRKCSCLFYNNDDNNNDNDIDSSNDNDNDRNNDNDRDKDTRNDFKNVSDCDIKVVMSFPRKF